MLTVGKTLQAEREKRGLSQKDVELATNIRAYYIDAIERDNYSLIPGEVYLKGFIRNYANLLTLDSSQLIEMYRQSQIVATAEAEAQTLVDEAEPESLIYSHRDLLSHPYFVWLVIGLVAVVSVVSVVSVVYLV
jgi:cytoskeletal protein RodZ